MAETQTKPNAADKWDVNFAECFGEDIEIQGISPESILKEVLSETP